MLNSISSVSRPACATLKPRLQVVTIIPSRYIRTRGSPPSKPSDPKKSSSSSSSAQDASSRAGGEPPPKPPSMENILAETNPADNPLLAPVHISEDANAVLKSDHPATEILTQSGLVVQRQLEMMNVFLGFEQANRYVILDPHGNHLGYMAEHTGGIGKTMTRQWLRTHRAFTTHVFDKHSREVLRFHRPFSWINTRIRVYDALEPNSSIQTSTSTDLTPQTGSDPETLQQISTLPIEAMRIIGEAHSQWAPLRRKYNLFLSHNPELSQPGPRPISTKSADDLSDLQKQRLGQSKAEPSFAQFAYIDEPFLSWDFSLLGEDHRLVGSVNRNFRGFAREIFTDTGSYVLRMDSAGLEQEAQNSHIISQTSKGEKASAEAVGGKDDKYGMTLDQRAVMLATAVTVDFDYFSRHSTGGGFGFMPLWMGGGGEAAGGAGAAGAGAGEAGAVVGGAGRAAGTVAGESGIAEGAVAGGASMASYEAMRRGIGGEAESAPQDASPQNSSYDQPYDSQSTQSGPESQSQGGDAWGQGDSDPWSGGTSGDEGGGGWLQWLWDRFFD